jgi:radical SAM superfamily enzyme YgiQ (UPF0313 family)
MKILLIAPNQRRIVSPSYMQKIQEGLGHLPPLGLMSIAGYILQNSNHQVSVIDALVDDLSHEKIASEIEKFQPDVIGIHAITYSLPDVLDTAKTARKAAPGAKIVMGGPHPTIYPVESLSFSEIDYVVAGEGEIPFFRLISHIEANEQSLLQIDGVIGKKDFDGNKPIPFVHKDLDILPFPPRELTPYKKYNTVVGTESYSTTIIGSRGCPYHCTFCHTAGGKVVRMRSIDKILEEIQACLNLGIKEFLFFDETFTLDRKRIFEFCNRVISQKLEISWDARCRVDLVDPEMLRLMKKAGCQRIQFGVESGNKRVLEVLKKGFHPEQAMTAIRATKKAGIAAYADFMIGNPGETSEEINETIAFARKLAPDYVHYSITIPLPFTALYYEALEKDIISEDYWLEFAKNPTDDFKVRYWEEIFSADDLEELVKKAYHNFYLSPVYMIKAIGKLKSVGELKRKFFAGLKLLQMGK